MGKGCPALGVYWSDNRIWGCTGFDLDENRSGEAGRGPRMPREKPGQTQAPILNTRSLPR